MLNKGKGLLPKRGCRLGADLLYKSFLKSDCHLLRVYPQTPVPNHFLWPVPVGLANWTKDEQPCYTFSDIQRGVA